MRGVRFGNCVPQCRVSCQPLPVHAGKHGDGYIRIVINLDFALVLVQAMQAPYVLLQRAFPRNRCYEQKGVQAGIVNPSPR